MEEMDLEMIRMGDLRQGGGGGGLSLCAWDQAPREPTLRPLQCNVIVRLHPGDPAPSGPPLGP